MPRKSMCGSAHIFGGDDVADFDFSVDCYVRPGLNQGRMAGE
ncbi:Uncharacterized protein ChrSV_2867 [Chromobacterium vaccinii]|nr:Uncharacterized protein ChrSW_2867 [Chromobacterium vaccinii]QND90324.1 Uncharacterized protein ChrSV_2867 [Chromobacterium vaccinii]